MGLFDKLFNKKASKEQVDITDRDSLGDIAKKLVDAGVAAAPKDKNHNTFGDPLDKLDNGELPFGWFFAKKDFVGPRDSKLFDLSARAAKAQSIDEEIELLKALISFYYEYQNECKSMGECYFKYFSDMHMHCHNSKNADFEFVAPAETRLKYIQDNYDKVIIEEKEKKEQENRKQELLINLRSELETNIKANPGILQSDLYKLFDGLIKDEISTILYYWSKDGTISREKNGRSYKLFWK